MLAFFLSIANKQWIISQIDPLNDAAFSQEGQFTHLGPLLCLSKRARDVYAS